MASLLIMADDFTGALDTGVQFARKGIPARVITRDLDDSITLDEGCGVLVVDAETRHLSSEESRRVILRLVEQAEKLGITHYYKKTDSALRGNVGAELSALMEGTGEKQLFFLPAYPSVNRTVENGVLYIDGTPVSESVFARDPFEPVTESVVKDLIGKQTDVPVIHSDVIHAAEELPDKEGIVVFDSVKEEDLESIGAVLKETDHLRVTAGCAGFGAVLPQFIDLPARKIRPLDLKKEILLICGSVNPITLKQMEIAEQNGFTRVRLKPRFKLHPQSWETEEGKEELERIRALLKQNDYRMLDVNDDDNNTATRACMEQEGISVDQARCRIAASVGIVTEYLLTRDDYGTVLMTGGDTLLGSMDRLGIHELRPVCEMAPGIVLSELKDGSVIPYVISKSGGFGAEDLLIQLKNQLQKKGE